MPYVIFSKPIRILSQFYKFLDLTLLNLYTFIECNYILQLSCSRNETKKHRHINHLKHSHSVSRKERWFRLTLTRHLGRYPMILPSFQKVGSCCSMTSLPTRFGPKFGTCKAPQCGKTIIRLAVVRLG